MQDSLECFQILLNNLSGEEGKRKKDRSQLSLIRARKTPDQKTKTLRATLGNPNCDFLKPKFFLCGIIFVAMIGRK